MPTKIEWTRNADGSQGESWNPIRARNKATGKQGHYCQRISPGCKHCYAAAMNVWRGNGVDYTVPGLDEVELYLDEDVLTQPLGWRKPRNVFVCSMTDLFAEFVPEEWIAQIYAVEAMCARHTFMHLTKRPERRRSFLTRFESAGEWAEYLSFLEDESGVLWEARSECHIANAINGVLAEGYNVGWPMKNVREGISVCNQKEADELIPILLATPASCRFVSAEPLLEAVNLTVTRRFFVGFEELIAPMNTLYQGFADHLDWVICGFESGPKARFVESAVEIARSLRDQCAANGVPFFFKQWGLWLPPGQRGSYGDALGTFENGTCKPMRLTKKAASALLDGVEYREFPKAA